jgi:hypothetical protein
MSWSTPDPYNQPEAFGLEIFASCGGGGGYDWDVFLVWKHEETGKVYVWSGSGCSCYGPCDDITKLEELDTVDSLQELLKDFDSWYTLDGWSSPSEADVVEFKSRVAELRF